MIPISIREVREEDVNFILNSWLKVMRQETPLDCDNDTFFDRHKRNIIRILQSADTFMAVNPEDQDQIFGYLVSEKPNVVHFGFVKSPFRRLEVFNRLLTHALQSELVIYTQRTWATGFFRNKYKLAYDPFRFYE